MMPGSGLYIRHDKGCELTHTVLLSLGSNIGDRLQYLRSAVAYLQKTGMTIRAVSSVYQTKAEIIEDQNDFFNAVIEIETNLSPIGVLAVCLGIETLLGRKREVRYGPRTIDIDVIDYSGLKLESQELTLPHPRLKDRIFVLYPLSDVHPGFVTQSGETVSYLMQSIKKPPPQKVASPGALYSGMD